MQLGTVSAYHMATSSVPTAMTKFFVRGAMWPLLKISCTVNEGVPSDLLVTFKCFAKRAQSVDGEIGTGVWRNWSSLQTAVILRTSVQLFSGMTVSRSP